MKVILPPIKAVENICGKQKYKESVDYRPTKHHLAFSCEEGQLLFHTLTESLVLLETGETWESSREELVKNWFLVPRDFDERKQADGVREVARLQSRRVKERTGFTILTTTDCNARCFYCYEMGIRRYAMTEETARDIGEYIVRACGGKKVNLSWFGGEPLYNASVIDTICDVLRKNGIEYSSIMTSNGYYLDAETATKAVRDWHVTSTQITIDGTEAIYNRTKAFIDRGEESPYQRVLRNIGTALDAGMEIAIRLNMDKANADDLSALADELGARFPGRKNLSAHVVLLTQYVGRIHEFGSREEAVRAQRALTEKLEEMGLSTSDKLTRRLCMNQCMADNDACEVILPDGRIEKCEHINDAQVIGSIYAPERDEQIIRAWKKTIRYPECETCEMYPLCCIIELCSQSKSGCDVYRQEEHRDRIKKMLLKAYHESKEGQEGNTDEAEEQLHARGYQW